MQHNKYVEHQDVKMYFAINKFPELQFIGTHVKPHGVNGLDNHYHMRFDTKLGHVTCKICCITCACTAYTSILDQPWFPDIPSNQQLRYQPVQD